MKKTIERPEFMSPFTLAYWKAAAAEVYNVRTLVVCAVLIAMRVALKAVYLPLGAVDIHVGFPINAVSGAICGPILSLISGAVSDLIGFAIAPKGSFDLFFTVVEMIGAFLYSIFLYRAKITSVRLLGAKASVNVIVNLVLYALGMYKYLHAGLAAHMIPRIAKNILLIPAEVLILIVVFNAVVPLLIKMRFIPSPQEKIEFKVIHLIITTLIFVGVVVLLCLYSDSLIAAFKNLFETAK